jgi:hypothetical protein
MKTLLVLSWFVFVSSVCAAQDLVCVVTARAPHYPPIALAEGAAEEIKVKVVVNERGEVLDARALSGVNSFLKRESENAAKKWAFGKSSGSRRELTVLFEYVVQYPPRNTEPDIEFSMPTKVTIRQHQPETSGPLPHK